MVFALLDPDAADLREDGAFLTYDKLAYVPDCGGEEFTNAYGLEREFAACWRNDNPMERTVEVRQSARITVVDPTTGDQAGLSLDELPILLAEDSGRRPSSIAVWRIRIAGGQVVQLDELPEAALSAADAKLAG